MNTNTASIWKNIYIFWNSSAKNRSTFLRAGESLSIAATTERITFTLNAGYNDGCENDMSPQCMLQLTSDASSIRPVTHIQVFKDLSCVWVHFTVVLYSVGHNRQRTKGQGEQAGRSRWMWLMSHAEVWHHAHRGTKVMWIPYVVHTVQSLTAKRFLSHCEMFHEV